MSIKSFTVGVKHHVNLGNYESMEVEAQVTMEVENNHVDDARIEAQGELAKLLSDTFEMQKKPTWFASIPLKRAKTIA